MELTDPKLAIELKNPAAFRLAVAIWPHLNELNHEEIQNHFLVFGLDLPGEGPNEVFSLVGPGWVAENVEFLTNASAWVPMKNLYFQPVNVNTI